MRLSAVALLMALGWQHVALAQLSDNELGYRDCNLKNLSACRNSNQLFVGPPALPPPPGYQKHDFTDALNTFLRNAPIVNGFAAYDVAVESITGPGDPPTQIAAGEIFIDGFTPHFAVDRAAVILTATGQIELVATLNRPDTTTEQYDFRRHFLRVYVHTQSPKREWLDHVQIWAKTLVSSFGPEASFAGTELLIANGRMQWETRLLP